MKVSFWIKSNGEYEKIIPTNHKDFSFSEFYLYCDTDIVEFVSMPGEYVMVVDEEGRYKNKTLNKKASILAGQPIIGDVVVCHKDLII